MSSIIPKRSDSVTSVTAQLPHFNGGSDQRQTSLDASEDGSQDSNPPGPHLLEEPMSDEFGLSLNAPSDGTDMGGKLKEDKTDTAPARGAS